MADETPTGNALAGPLPVTFTVTAGPGETARLPVTFSIAVARLPVTLHIPTERYLRLRLNVRGELTQDFPVRLLVRSPEPRPPVPPPTDYNLMTVLEEGPYVTISYTEIRSGVPIYEMTQKSGPDNVSRYVSPDGSIQPPPESLVAEQIPATPHFDDLFQPASFDTKRPNPEAPYRRPGDFFPTGRVVLSVSETTYEYDRYCPERLLRKDRKVRERVPILTVMSPTPNEAVLVCADLIVVEREIITQKWGSDGALPSVGAPAMPLSSRGVLARRNTVHAMTEPVVVLEDTNQLVIWPTSSKCDIQKATVDYGNGDRANIPIYHWFYADITGEYFKPARLPSYVTNPPEGEPIDGTGILVGSGDVFEETPTEIWDPNAVEPEWITLANSNNKARPKLLQAEQDDSGVNVPNSLRIDLTAESWQPLPQGLYYYRKAEYKTRDVYINESSIDTDSSANGLYLGRIGTPTGVFSRASQSMYSEVNDTPPAIAECQGRAEEPPEDGDDTGVPDGGSEDPPQPDKPSATRPEWQPQEPDEPSTPEDNWIILPPSGNTSGTDNAAIVDDMRNMDSIRGTPITQEVDPDPGIQSQQVTSPLFSPMTPEEYPAVYGLALIGQQEAANAVRPATLSMTEIIPSPIAFEWSDDVARVQIAAQQNFQITIQREILEETGVVPEI